MHKRAFSLLELMVALVVVSVLAILGIQAGSRVRSGAYQADSLARLKTLGQAMFLYAGEHEHSLPGPLWPGQMMTYDPNREGRLVRELAPYLDIEARDSPYLVTGMIPLAYRRAVPDEKLPLARIYVMNTIVQINGVDQAPFGSLLSDPPTPAMRRSQLQNLSIDDRWMISEADQKHPEVAHAPWKGNTPPEPLHEGRRAVMDFDGAVRMEAASSHEE